LVQAKWFGRFTQIPRDIIDDGGRIIEKNIRRTVVSVDCANKPTQRANYSVCTVWIETMAGHHYLVHVARKKVEITALTKMIEDTAVQWNANAIIVEDKGHGTTYIQTRTGKAPAPVIAIQVDGKGKEMRFDDVMPTIESGVVFIPKSAPWLPEYEAELLAFPNGTDDDQVDSTSQYLKWAVSRGQGGTKKLKGMNRDKVKSSALILPGPASLITSASGVDLTQVKQNFIGG
jgi:predicted phage terminase large subunit-like protein